MAKRKPRVFHADPAVARAINIAETDPEFLHDPEKMKGLVEEIRQGMGEDGEENNQEKGPEQAQNL